MRPRDTMRLYQTAARVWLTSAALALLLPADVRLEWWVPLHLFLIGAVSVAISGAMQNFVAALTATGPAPASMTWAQFVTINAGAALLVAGRSSGVLSVVGVGGTLFLVAIALLTAILVRGVGRALHLRHRLPVAMYLVATFCVLAGGAIGIVLGMGAVHGAFAYLDLRSAHMVVNVLGWVSLTIAGTLITLLPTVLRVRMAVWTGTTTGVLFTAGVATMAVGLAFGVGPVAVAGGFAYAAATFGLLVMVRRVMATERKWPVPISARHLLAALAWFACGSVWLVVELARGPTAFETAGAPFVVIFAGGWILQTLLGAWSYLLPMARPAHPEERRAFLAAVEWGGKVQLGTVNGGLALLAISASGLGPPVLATIGAALALFGACFALLKVWTYPILGRSTVFTRGSIAMWEPAIRRINVPEGGHP